MATISFACPNCQRHLSAPPEMSGRVTKCPACQKQVGVPRTGSVPGAGDAPRRPPLPTAVAPPVAAKKDNLVRNVGIIAGAIGVLVIAVLTIPDLFRDKWELQNTHRILDKLKEASQLEQSDPLAAYKTYDEVLKEAKQHKIAGELLSQKVASAENSRTTLYAIVQKKLRAEEAEKQRRATEESRLANEEKQRIAEEKEARERRRAEQLLAEQRVEKRKRELKEQAAKYRNASPQARAALNALKRIQARTEVGVSYMNYSQVLGEQYGEVKIFLESPEGQSMPLFSSKISEAIKQYKQAMEAWKLSIDQRLDSGDGIQTPWSEASKAIKKAEEVLLNPEKELEASPSP